MHDKINDFRASMQSYGLEPPQNIEPGKFYRFPGIGKDINNTAGWCKLFNHGLGGCFGDYSSNLSETWQAAHKQSLTDKERRIFNHQVKEAKQQAEIQQKVRKTNAQKEAIEIWKNAVPVPNHHPYLIKKAIKPYGLRYLQIDKLIGRMQCKDSIIVPVRQGKTLYSLQFITPTGDKRFLPNGHLNGGYFSIGHITDAFVLCIAEGVATATTIYEATGYPAAAAFNANNLIDVGIYLRHCFPNIELLFCADDDHLTTGNPGLTKAQEAANKVNGTVIKPNFGLNRAENATDFNDLQQKQSLQSVKDCINNALIKKYNSNINKSDLNSNTQQSTAKHKSFKEPNQTLDDIEPHPQRVNPEQLLNEIESLIMRTIVCDVESRIVTTLWITMT